MEARPSNTDRHATSAAPRPLQPHISGRTPHTRRILERSTPGVKDNQGGRRVPSLLRRKAPCLRHKLQPPPALTVDASRWHDLGAERSLLQHTSAMRDVLNSTHHTVSATCTPASSDRLKVVRLANSGATALHRPSRGFNEHARPSLAKSFTLRTGAHARSVGKCERAAKLLDLPPALFGTALIPAG